MVGQLPVGLGAVGGPQKILLDAALSDQTPVIVTVAVRVAVLVM